jgi:hypothetical protein
MFKVPEGKPVMTIAHNTSSTSIYLSWTPPPTDKIFGEFLGYRITYRARDVQHTANEILIRESSVEVSKKNNEGDGMVDQKCKISCDVLSSQLHKVPLEQIKN